MFNPQAAIAAAAEVGPDMREAQAGGGGDYTPPAEGPVRLRLVSYVELGVHHDERYNKNKDEVFLEFELSGPKHPPREFDGKKVPQTIGFRMNKSLNQKASYYKLFKRLNHTGEYKHFAQLLGQAFLGTIHHNVSGEGDKKRTYANLSDENGYTIRPPFREDFDTGESVPVAVDEPLSPIRCFIWDSPVQIKEMWDSIFIDGRWDDEKDDSGKVVKEGRSKNFMQERIKAAVNFEGSPIHELLFAGEVDTSSMSAQKPDRSEENKQKSEDAKKGAAADPLAEI